MKCFYHASDMDGWCSAAVIAKATLNKNKDDYIGIDYNTHPFTLDIVNDVISTNEIIYISDISFTEKTMNILDAIIDKVGIENIHWNDHHASSLNLCAEYDKYKNIPGVRNHKLSGALLTYLYLQKLYPERLSNIVPEAILYVSDWDTFTHANGLKTLYFKYGIDADNWYRYPLSDQWSKLLMYPANMENKYLNKVLSDGKIIYNYVMCDYENYRKANAYESAIGDIPIVVLNRSANSLIFGDLYNIYPAVVTFSYDGEKFKYSIYSNDKFKDIIDCSKIAESYGGGGHRGAAGFSADNILFKKTSNNLKTE